jgi:hypothetical protein
MQNAVQATRAYIASAGTAVVMLGASLCMFVVVSAFVAFGSWPGAESHASVDRVLLRDVATPRPKTVAVRADAVVVARHAEQRRVARRRAVARTTPRPPSAKGPAGTTTPTNSPATGTAPSAASPAPAPAPGAQAPVQQHAADVKQQVDTTTGDVTTQVRQQTQTVQTEVNQVLDQVTGVVNQVTSTPPPPVTTTVDGVKDAAGSLLGG